MIKSKTIILIVLLSLIHLKILSNTDSSKTRHLSVGLSIPHFTFRDYTSSSLAYKGYGIGELNFVLNKTSNNSIWQINMQLGIGNAKPDLKNKNNWNENAEIYYYSVEYNYLKSIKQNIYNKLKIYAGGILASNAQYVFYPTINNVQAYNFTALSIQVTSKVSYNLKIGKKNTIVSYQLATQIFGYNSRPLSYIGVIPENAIWNQKENSISLYYKNGKTSSFHNNIVIQSSLFWNLKLKKNRICFGYQWLYQNNKVSINTLTSIKSSFSVAYQFNLSKNKK